jgi:DNA-binding MarR family transcriptional regulator
MPKKRSERDPHKAARSLTDVEWTIMDVVWQHEPCAAGTVQEALVESRGWAYSTVKTTMDRMVDKGARLTLQGEEEFLEFMEGLCFRSRVYIQSEAKDGKTDGWQDEVDGGGSAAFE